MEQVLVFRAGRAVYGLEVTEIQEIVESPPLHYIPRGPAHFLGAINFHGGIIPVLDLGAYLGLGGDQRDHRVIVLNTERCAMALAVEAIRRIVAPLAGLPLPSQGDLHRRHFVRAVMDHEEDTIHLLDVARLLASFDRT